MEEGFYWARWHTRENAEYHRFTPRTEFEIVRVENNYDSDYPNDHLRVFVFREEGSHSIDHFEFGKRVSMDVQENRAPTQEFVIRNVLVGYCGQSLSAKSIDILVAEIVKEITSGPSAWAFEG